VASRLEGLWEPPSIELASRTRAGAALLRELERLGFRAHVTRTPHRIRHRITHHELTVEVWSGTLLEVASAGAHRSGVRFVDARSGRHPLSGLARKILEAATRA
jgi:hypothetical protein